MAQENERAFKTINDGWKDYVNHAEVYNITQGYIPNENVRVRIEENNADKEIRKIIIRAPQRIQPWVFEIPAKDAKKIQKFEALKNGTIRIRRAANHQTGKIEVFLTIKSKREIQKKDSKPPISKRKEWEYEAPVISVAQADDLLQAACATIIYKTRHYLDLGGELSSKSAKCTVDVFSDPPQGFNICEIESVKDKFKPENITEYPSFISLESEVTGQPDYTSRALAKKNPHYLQVLAASRS
jgi:CYTH domain-containing protein